MDEKTNPSPEPIPHDPKCMACTGKMSSHLCEPHQKAVDEWNERESRGEFDHLKTESEF